ncbi:MarR family winged helix-turn-helix transcriptional regulator [Paraburkholderia megapolitana]|uniref:DNA-binding transcriptional regulator, MarR family n=1 Tax=Paraburkholderia megapolitana TaxID=420953 RepID=A0A1I3SSW3_9BURK|nr:MarR family winged helix-turn-helix transcriptional regulator [Paraburkholderia megapolitana]QDQ85607.1 winged helix-turn-helix transcriptional regulator [Paraburkholderia megapolitana]SFJ60671.1 DNA-binding transcriptional regulator, MarR family [Paraburkholderia megapolitana]
MSTQLEELGLAIKKVQSRHHRVLDDRLQRLGVSLVQWNALREIDRNPGSNAHRLAELTFNSDQAFGTLTTRLLRLGFIEREAGLGRANAHHLTASGKAMLAEGKEVMRAVLEASFAPLDDEEQTTLLEILGKLLDHPLDDDDDS